MFREKPICILYLLLLILGLPAGMNIVQSAGKFDTIQVRENAGGK
jgi:hypothetical protein